MKSKILIALLLFFVAGAIAFFFWFRNHGFSARAEPSWIEARLARHARRIPASAPRRRVRTTWNRRSRQRDTGGQAMWGRRQHRRYGPGSINARHPNLQRWKHHPGKHVNGRRRGCVAGKPDVREHRPDHALVGDLRDRLHPAAAVATQQDVDRKDSAEQLGPSPFSPTIEASMLL